MTRQGKNPLIGDHSRWHERRVGLIKRMLLMNIWFLRHGEERVTEWLVAGEIYDSHHDKDQAITQQRNLNNKTGLKSKSMHDAAGAVRIGIFPDLLAKAGDLTDKEAETQLTAAMVMILVHAEPELMQARLTTAGRAADYRHDPQSLFDAWMKGKINVFSLTKADTATILSIGKAIDGFVTKDTPFGLDPDFESFNGNQTRLKKFSRENDTTLGEILGFSEAEITRYRKNRYSINIEEKSRDHRFRSFIHMTHVQGLADLIDMYHPGLESLFRKVLVPYSRARPWFRMKGFGQKNYYQLCQRRPDGPGKNYCRF